MVDDPGVKSDWIRWALLGLTGLVSATVVVIAFTPAPHTGGDNAGYIALAYSLLTDGSYTEIFDPAGLPHTKYPPVFPALLAGLMLLGARSWAALKTVAAISTVATALLTYLWAERRLGPVWAFGVALAASGASAVLYYSHWVLSDPTFVALTILSLWALERSDDSESGRRWLVIGVVGAGIAYFTRSAGVPLLVAVGAWLLLRRRWRAMAAMAMGVGVPAVLWLLRARGAGQGDYGSEFWLIDPYTPSMGRIGGLDMADRIVGNLIGYVGTHVPAGIVGSQGVAVGVLGVAVVALGGAGWIFSARRTVGPAELFLPLYAGLLLVWPEVWSGDRFALPLYPLLFGYGAFFLREVVGRRNRSYGILAGCVALAAVLVPALGSWVGTAGEASACAARTKVQGPFSCYGSRVGAFVEAAGWAGRSLPGGASVLSRKPRLFFVLSGLPSRTFPFDTRSAAHLAEADGAGARYELLDEWDGLASRYVLGAVQEDPGAFCSIRGFGETGRTQLLGILPTEARTGPQESVEGSIRLALCPAEYVAESREAPYPSSGRIPLLDELDP